MQIRNHPTILTILLPQKEKVPQKRVSTEEEGGSRRPMEGKNKSSLCMKLSKNTLADLQDSTSSEATKISIYGYKDLNLNSFEEPKLTTYSQVSFH